MNPIVTKVTQQNTLNAAGQIVHSIVLTYTVGPHGPFTLVTTGTEIANGQAKAKLQAFATSLSTLPLQTAS